VLNIVGCVCVCVCVAGVAMREVVAWFTVAWRERRKNRISRLVWCEGVIEVKKVKKFSFTCTYRLSW